MKKQYKYFINFVYWHNIDVIIKAEIMARNGRELKQIFKTRYKFGKDMKFLYCELIFNQIEKQEKEFKTKINRKTKKNDSNNLYLFNDDEF